MGAERVNIYLAVVCFFVFLKIVVAFLNIEEITSVNYGIDILNKPVLSGQVASGSVMYLKSRFGQEYQCSLPEVSLPSDEARLADDPSATAEVDIAQLLRPLEEAPCLVKMKDWWTYEFCYGKFIRQYHMEDNKIISPEIFLGYYESEYDWKNDTATQDESSRNRLQRYHSQYYVNGTRCDVTGALRKAEVRFLCEEGSGNYIARVDEPESCRYILTIHTAHVCHHPYLRPPPSNKPQPVTCNPVLTAEQYEEYLIEEEESKREAEEQRWKWLAQQEERLEQLKKRKADKAASSTNDDKSTKDLEAEGNADSDDERPWMAAFKTWERIVKQEQLEQANKPNAEPVDFDDPRNKFAVSKPRKGLDDWEKRLESVAKVIEDKIPSRYAGKYSRELESEQTDSNDDAEASSPSSTNKADNDDSLASKEDPTTHKLEESSEKGIKSGKNEKQGDSTSSKPLSLEDHFTEIMEEAEEELNENLAKEDGDSFNHLAATLNKLMKKLDRAEQDINQASKTLEKFQQKIDTQSSVDKEDADELVKVRVTHSGAHNRGKHLQEKEVDESHRHQLEKVIRHKLEQSGLDTTGRKIEVKIITAEYPGNDDDPNVHILSDEESQQFQHLIITFLAGNQEAAEQMERQQRLEENYRFVWGQGKRKAQLTEVKSEENEDQNDESSNE